MRKKNDHKPFDFMKTFLWNEKKIDLFFNYMKNIITARHYCKLRNYLLKM